MATTKNLCAQIPIDLHERVSEERERLGQTTSEYITNLIQEYYDMIENQKGGIQMTEKGRTMAFQIPEELFQRIKRHLERETLRNGKKLTQRDFVLNLITQALDEADAENAAEQNAPTEAPVAPRVADVTAPANTDTPDEDNAVYARTKAKTKEHDLGKATQGIRIYRMPWVAFCVSSERRHTLWQARSEIASQTQKCRSPEKRTCRSCSPTSAIR